MIFIKARIKKAERSFASMPKFDKLKLNIPKIVHNVVYNNTVNKKNGVIFFKRIKKYRFFDNEYDII